MTTDLTMLAWTAGVTLLMWVPYILARLAHSGVLRALTYVADDEPLPLWATRAKRAHYNAVENLVPFAALVLVAHVTGIANGTTALAATVYFWARVAHWAAYVSGIPFTRTVTFTVAWAMQIWILVEILGAAGGGQ